MASSPFSVLFTATLVVITSLFLVPQLLAVKLPFHPRDVLPLLPRQVSWPVLNSLHSAADLLPSFVGSASSPNNTLEWKGACFYKNTAWMEFHNKTGTEFGGGTLHIKVFRRLISLLFCLWSFVFSVSCRNLCSCLSGLVLDMFYFQILLP